MVDRKPILSVPVDDINYAGILNAIEEALERKKKLTIAYAGVNTFNLMHRLPELQQTLSQFSIIHSDGIGIWLASRFLLREGGLSERFTWTDHIHQFLQECCHRGWKIFFLGSTPEEAADAERRVRSQFPSLQLVGCLDGYELADSPETIQKVNAANADILWVGMGSPKQEFWIAENREKLGCPIIQAVGDGITFLAGKKIRGPVWAQKLGFEWFFRLLLRPRIYFVRYAIGIPLFIARVLREKIRFSTLNT